MKREQILANTYEGCDPELHQNYSSMKNLAPIRSFVQENFIILAKFYWTFFFFGCMHNKMNL